MAAPMKKKHGMKNRKTKVFLEFDEKARADYLKGFQKRKKERKEAAREKRDKLIKDERKALRQQIRDLKTSKSLALSYKGIPEIEQLVEPDVFDLPEHTVTIANIGQVDFVGKTGLRLGQNNLDCIPADSEVEKSEDEAEHEEIPDTSQQETSNATTSKSLIRKLAGCSNQLSSQMQKSKKNNRKQNVRAKLQAKKLKRKKNQKNKSRKR